MRFRSRIRPVPVALVAGLLLLSVGGIAVAARSHGHHVFRGKRSVLTAAEIRRLSTGAKKRTIIVFNNQLSNLPARKGTARARASASSIPGSVSITTGVTESPPGRPASY